MVNFHISSQKLGILHFDGFFLCKSYKVSAKNVKTIYLSWHWRVMQTLKKNWLEEFGDFLPNHSKVWKIFSVAFFYQYTMFKLQKYRGVNFHNIEQWYKIWINSDHVNSKMAWGIELTFIRALKSLKTCTLMYGAYNMFQLENLNEQLTGGLKNNIRNLVNFYVSSSKTWRFEIWHKEFV